MLTKLSGSDRTHLVDPELTLEDRRLLGIDYDDNQLQVENAHMSTVKGILLSGPFAGPFVVDVVRYTGSFRTKYFWNGHQVLRKEVYLCGVVLPTKKVLAILDALKQGIQYDNSTVPMIVTDLLSNKELTSDDVMGEPTMDFFKKLS